MDTIFGRWRRGLGTGRRRRDVTGGRRAAVIGRFETLEPRLPLDGSLVISEFLASNDNDVRDADRNRPDWIELLNTDRAAQNLDGWYLTDDPRQLTKWRFPAVRLEPNERLLVFASGKDRADPDAELHTNFRLAASGGYLALVRPDGQSVAFDFGDAYPRQNPDISFGLPQSIETRLLHEPGENARIFVPRDGRLERRWTLPGFDDASWREAPTGLGYGSAFGGVVATDLRSELKGVSPALYVRIPFTLDAPATISNLTLSMQYNDGFVAYLNGVEVARRNAPADVAFNALATARRSSSDSLVVESFDLSPYVGELVEGENVLAIHGMNSNASSSRFLVVPRLEAVATGALEVDARSYFPVPSAGRPNGEGTPIGITGVTHTPVVPDETQPLTVTATAAATSGEAVSVTLYYRVMFGDERSTPMFDDGQHGDGAAGDGVFGAILDAGIARPGEMIRYRITAESPSGNPATSPPFVDPLETQQYYGTVVTGPAQQSQLPTIQLFLEDPEASETNEGTRGSLFHDGEFYDNIAIDPTGRTVGRSGPKKSHDVFLPRDHWFRLAGEPVRMDDFDLITDYWNRAKVRIPLAYQTFRDIGTPSHLSLPVRVDRNGAFFGTYSFVDGGNATFLERAGLDREGALYKMNLGFSSAGGFKKQTRRFEDNADLRAFFRGLGLEGEARTRFLFDHVDIPAVVNFWVGLVIAAHGDCCSKNLYLYRDTEGSGDWETLPWDVNSAFGNGGVGSEDIFPASASVDFTGRGNLLFQALFQDVPGFKEMYLRRLRTVMDQFLQPPGTPEPQRWFEHRVDAMAQPMGPDVALDFAKWGGWGEKPTWEEQLGILRNEYFPRRRVFLYNQARDVPGDMDFSGAVDGDDVDDFVLGLRDPEAYRRQYGMFAVLRGDANRDHVFDYDDIAPWIDLIGTQPRPTGTIPPPQIGAPPIEFGRIEANPASGDQDEEYIELVNPNDVAVDITGWQLRGGVRMTFAPGTVLPAGGTLYVSPNIRAFRARASGPSGDQGLFVQGDYAGHISNLGETIRLVAGDGTLVREVTTPAAPSAAQAQLRISEIMYHPRDVDAGSLREDDDFEYLELVNTSSNEPLDLEGVRLTRGVELTFPNVVLPPGGHVLAVRNLAAFAERYGEVPGVVVEYGPSGGKLSNGGEEIKLVDAAGDTIQSFTYSDAWYPSTDGNGRSLEMIDPGKPDLELWSNRAGWRPSAAEDGTPGRSAASASPATAGTEVDERFDWETLVDLAIRSD